MAESHRTAQDRRAGEAHLSGFQDDRLVKRLVPEPLIFAEKNTKQYGVARQLHGHTYFTPQLTHKMMRKPGRAVGLKLSFDDQHCTRREFDETIRRAANEAVVQC